jgi:branched-chain amino acid transport system permease protein
MTTLSTSRQPDAPSVWHKNPTLVTALLVAYIVATMLVLRSLDRTTLWFPTLSTIAFPAFVLSPFLILASPVPQRTKMVLIVLVVVVAMPLVGIFDNGYLELAIQICIFTGLALGLNIVVGFAGLLDLGYIAFFAVGAYTWAMFTSTAPTIFNINGWLVPGWAFPVFLVIGVLAAAVTGIILGLPVLRLRGDYLAIVTLGFGEMIRVLARNLGEPTNITNGSQGLHSVASPPVPEIWSSFIGSTSQLLNIPILNITPVSQQLMFYFVGVVIVGIIIVVARRLDDSPIGRAWTAIREDEVAAIAMGVPLVKMKLLAFATGASFAGAIGVLYAAKQTFVSPESFSLIQSISILAMVIVGGLGGIRGVILGATVVTLLNLQLLKNFSLQLNGLRQIDAVVLGFHIRDWPTQLEPAKYERLVFGLLLIVMMIFRPSGILPEPRRRIEMTKNASDRAAEDPKAPTVQESPSAPVE